MPFVLYTSRDQKRTQPPRNRDVPIYLPPRPSRAPRPPFFSFDEETFAGGLDVDEVIGPSRCLIVLLLRRLADGFFIVDPRELSPRFRSRRVRDQSVH
ncbi:uncharacterized protein J3R85_011366 [Psidium guajava]|nr:uncharacterized protein J3R85_011366 [Psidium guajava]